MYGFDIYVGIRGLWACPCCGEMVTEVPKIEHEPDEGRAEIAYVYLTCKRCKTEWSARVTLESQQILTEYDEENPPEEMKGKENETKNK